jgi:hypothetical protein
MQQLTKHRPLDKVLQFRFTAAAQHALSETDTNSIRHCIALLTSSVLLLLLLLLSSYLSLAAHAADQVAYGQIVTYRWLVTESAGPGPADSGSIMLTGGT